MAPELLLHESKAQPAMDLFSLGITLYEMASPLDFVLPTHGNRWQELRRGGLSRVSFPSDTNQSLVNLILSMVHPDPNHRPSAATVLTQSNALNKAGSTCDVFLRDYLLDVDRFDQWEEERLLQQQADPMVDEQTPQGGGGLRRRVLSPSLGSPLMMPPAAPSLFASPALPSAMASRNDEGRGENLTDP